MKEIRRHITITKKTADMIIKLLTIEPKTEKECFGEDETISYTANFGYGIQMDIKVCGVQYEEGGTNTAWSEAVLFNHGSEVACSEPSDGFMGEWELEYDGKKYITEVKAEYEMHTIWHNDACDEYDALEKEMEGAEESEIWQAAYDNINTALDDEMTTLDIEAQGDLFLVGIMEHWDRGYSAYYLLNTSNIGQSLPRIAESFDSNDHIHIYEQGGHVFVSQLGHDNPVNPSIFELRAFAVDFDDLDDDYTPTLMSNSQPVGAAVAKKYGWNVEE